MLRSRRPDASSSPARPLATALIACAVAALGCGRPPATAPTPAALPAPAEVARGASPAVEAAAPPVAPAAPVVAVALAAPLTPSIAADAVAKVGQPAPDFVLPDTQGRLTRLSEAKGKVLVLEWYNPDCPFVKHAHTEGGLVDRAARAAAEGVVWLAINSGAPGMQGHGQTRNHASIAEYKLGHPVLLDESGGVGRAYGATNTPHLYVIDPAGVLVYAGALDNLPYGEQAGEGPERHYLDEALVAARAGQPVPTPMTKAWGCSVKYGS